jgi:biotin carboxylase
MTKDDILRMAREAGCVDPMVFFGAYERFAALVAAAERERACRIVTGLCISDNNAREINTKIREGST